MRERADRMCDKLDTESIPAGQPEMGTQMPATGEALHTFLQRLTLKASRQESEKAEQQAALGALSPSMDQRKNRS